MSDRDELLQLIKDLAVVHGRVTLSSGREADYYIDLRRRSSAACCARSRLTGPMTRWAG